MLPLGVFYARNRLRTFPNLENATLTLIQGGIYVLRRKLKFTGFFAQKWSFLLFFYAEIIYWHLLSTFFILDRNLNFLPLWIREAFSGFGNAKGIDCAIIPKLWKCFPGPDSGNFFEKNRIFGQIFDFSLKIRFFPKIRFFSEHSIFD